MTDIDKVTIASQLALKFEIHGKKESETNKFDTSTGTLYCFKGDRNDLLLDAEHYFKSEIDILKQSDKYSDLERLAYYETALRAINIAKNMNLKAL